MQFITSSIDLSNIKPESPRGKVLGSINPNSIRAHSSRKVRKSCSKTPKSNSRKKVGSTLNIFEDKDDNDEETTRTGSPPNQASPSNCSSAADHISSPTEEFGKVARGSLFVDVEPNYPKPKSPLSKLSTTSTQQFSTSPRSSLASAPTMKTPSPQAGAMGGKKLLEQRPSTMHQLPLSLGGRYSSPTDNTFSPCTTAMLTNKTQQLHPRKAMAEKKYKTRQEEMSKGTKETKETQNTQDVDELSVIIPLHRKNKYTKAQALPASSSSLPSLSSKQASHLFSPTDSLFSPVSSNFYQKKKGGKLEKINARKSIFLKQNKK